MLDERLHGFAAGILAGGAGVLVGHPFDTLKVKMQVARQGVARQGSSAAPPADTPSCRSAALPRLSAYRALYRGVLPPLLSTGIVQSINFGIFENSRKWLQSTRLGCFERTNMRLPSSGQSRRQPSSLRND